MFDSITPRLSRLTAVFLILGTVVACGGHTYPTRNPSPAPSATPTPTPTPTPLSTLESFKVKIASSDFQAQGTVSGSVVANLIIGSASGPVTGTFKIKGGDSAVSIAFDIMGNHFSYDSIVVGGTAYSRSNGGGWSNSPASGKTLQGFVSSGIALTDTGIETRSGRQLHHIAVADVSGVDPSAFGITAGSGQENLKLESISFWAEDDGTPAGLSIRASLDQKVYGTPSHETVTLEINIDSLSDVSITAPTE